MKTYEVSERFPLGSISALIRFIEEPQKLGIEWMDGTTPTFYTSTSRDAILAAILDTSQTNAARPIPVIPDVSMTGDTIYGSRHGVGSSLPVSLVPELEHLYLRVLSDLGKTAHPAIYPGNPLVADLKHMHVQEMTESSACSSDNEDGPPGPERSSVSRYSPSLNSDWKVA